MIRESVIEESWADIEKCLNCVLPECDEGSPECSFHNQRKEDVIDKAKLTLEQKRVIAAEAHERGVRVVAEEKGIDWKVIRGWVSAWYRKPKGDNGHEELSATTEIAEADKDENSLRIFFYKALEQDSILEAKAFWAGVKAAKGL